MKLLPLSEYIDRKVLSLATSHLSARIKESLFKENVTSICKVLLVIQVNIVPWWRRGVVVITTAQLHSAKSELRFYAGSHPARGVSEINDGEDL